jgi:GTP-binding protein Era
VTPTAQSTRQRLVGFYTDEAHQAVFVDTPGLLRPRYLLQQAMLEDAEDAIGGADVLLYVVDAGYAASVEHARGFPRPEGRPAILCLNKADRVTGSERRELADTLAASGWATVVTTVASEGRGVDELRAKILDRLPPSEPLYPPDDLAVAPVRFFVAERVRETAFELLAEEVPYAIAVTVESYREPAEEGRPVYIEAVIHVERPSQKGILIGASGAMIRQIGTISRRKIEELLGQPVYLDLHVKVLRNWRKREGSLKLLGFHRPR